MDYLELTKLDIKEEKHLLNRYETELKRLPDGYLICNTKGERIDYYHVVDGVRNYIRRKDQWLIEDLKRKKYLKEAVRRIKENIRVQENIIDKYQSYDYSKIQEKLKIPYQQQQKKTYNFSETKAYKNQPLHQTSIGLKVRSKSEVMIVEALVSRGIEFQYEQPLVITDIDGNTKTIYPDFSFKNRYGQWIYWEHFGMLGKSFYRKDAEWKFRQYTENNIFPSINLLITAESADGELDMATIVGTIEYLMKLL